MIGLEKTDIAVQPLYINKLILVIRSQMQKSSARHIVNGRHSDAFVYILSGSCRYRFDDGTQFTVREGDLLYLADQAIYEMTLLSENYRFIFCDFTFEHDIPRKSNVYSPQDTSEAQTLFRRLLRCHQNPTGHSFPEEMSLLYQIYGIVQFFANSQYLEKSVRQKLEQIKAHIDINFSDNTLSVSRLAELGNVSEVYFRKIFKTLYGISPSQYITNARLKQAESLMKYPFLTLEECAKQSGFSTLQYFCRVFKKVKGITPAQYRKETYS